MSKKIVSASLGFFLIFLCGCKEADLQQVARAIEGYQPGLDQATVVAGLKQALEIGTGNSVQKTGKPGGFSDNPALKILVPEKFSKLAKTMRKYGMASYVDRFELQMNRSAEAASIEAKAVFINSIKQMTLDDAWGILKGPDDAATQYFRRTTSSELRQKFKPIITSSMNKVGFYSDYKKLLTTYQSLPLSDKPNLNIEDYVMDKTLTGLFSLVAEEEAKIRHDPAARVTDLLRRVFGS